MWEWPWACRTARGTFLSGGPRLGDVLLLAHPRRLLLDGWWFPVVRLLLRSFATGAPYTRSIPSRIGGNPRYFRRFHVPAQFGGIGIDDVRRISCSSDSRLFPLHLTGDFWNVRLACDVTPPFVPEHNSRSIFGIMLSFESGRTYRSRSRACLRAVSVRVVKDG